mgnify:CR=1 FL=1
MHVIHDDMLGLYFLLKQFSRPSQDSQKSGLPSDYNPFNLDSQVLFLDDHTLGTYANLVKYFSEKYSFYLLSFS